MNRRLSLILLFTILSATWSCGKRDLGPDSGETLATVNGEAIRSGEFIEDAKMQMRFRGGDYSLMEKKMELLNYLIDNELLFQEALREKVAHNPVIKGHIIRVYLQQEIPANYEPGDDKIREYYNKNRLDLERVQASHILIKFGPQKSEAQALAEIRKIEKKLQAAKGTDFGDLAAKFSEDPGSKTRRGDLGYFPRGRMVKAFDEAAFGLKKVGEVSPPVKTEYGYHLIKLTGDQRGLERLRLRIKEQLVNDWRRGRYQTLIEKLRSRASIKRHEKRLAALPLGEPAPALKPPAEAKAGK